MVGSLLRILHRFYLRIFLVLKYWNCSSAFSPPKSPFRVQGPQAVPLVDSLLKDNLRALGYYRATTSHITGIPCFVSRTGYTGEDGCELIVRSQEATQLWRTLLGETDLERNNISSVTPVGLAARDTLRLEAAMPLYGHELTEQIDPGQAGLEFALNLKNRDFIGRDAILRLQTDKNIPIRVGLQLSGRRVPRTGQTILLEDRPVGTVTSGTFSPTLEKPIAMGYIVKTAASTGQQLTIDIRGMPHQAKVVPLPFYQRQDT